MIWADRIAAVWGGLLLVIMFMAWKGPMFMLSDPGVWYVLWLILGIPWLVLRGLDLAFTGRVRLRSTAVTTAKPQRPGTVEILPPQGRR